MATVTLFNVEDFEVEVHACGDGASDYITLCGLSDTDGVNIFLSDVDLTGGHFENQGFTEEGFQKKVRQASKKISCNACFSLWSSAKRTLKSDFSSKAKR